MKRLISFMITLCITVGCCATPAYAAGGTLNISSSAPTHKLSECMYGISLDDISYSCDGGLVSDMVNNGSFEMVDNAENAWRYDNITAVLSADDPICKTNPTYETLTIDGKGAITNIGYPELYKHNTYKYNGSSAGTPDMGFCKGERYNFSCYIKNIDFDGAISVSLDSKRNRDSSAQLKTDSISTRKWTRLSTVLKSDADEDGGLTIRFEGKGSLKLDFVSLVPQSSHGYGTAEWKYTTLRSDLMEVLGELSPSFIRFPGGCTAEGTSISPYCWKDTIGSPEQRTQLPSVYSDPDNGNYYNNTSAMGYHEYFQLCEDLGAEPVPVVGAAISCQDRNGYDDHLEALHKATMVDEQWTAYLVETKGYGRKDSAGIAARTEYIESLGIRDAADFDAYLDTIAFKPGSRDFANYAQDILDLIEYANGDSATTYWGSQRAANGHPAPFNMKYIGIGNDNRGDVYIRNFNALRKIIRSKYPEITVIASSGAAVTDDTSAAERNDISTGKGVMLNEQYRTTATDMVSISSNYNGSASVCEYAAVTEFGNVMTKNNAAAAAAEAALATTLERHSDKVKMTAYSPTLAKINANTDDVSMIWFDSRDIVLTPSYYARLLLSANTGTEYLDTDPIGIDRVFSSVTIDRGAQALYIKLVNCNSGKKRVSVSLDAFGDINRISCQSVGDRHRTAANDIGKRSVTPQEQDIDPDGNTFDITLGAYSTNVVRVAYGDNTGQSLYSLPEESVSRKSSHKAAIACVIIIICAAFAVAAAYILRTHPLPRRRRDDLS